MASFPDLNRDDSSVADELSEAIKQAKEILKMKVGVTAHSVPQPELTQKVEDIVKGVQSKSNTRRTFQVRLFICFFLSLSENRVAGHTSEYVTKQINKYM